MRNYIQAHFSHWRYVDSLLLIGISFFTVTLKIYKCSCHNFFFLSINFSNFLEILFQQIGVESLQSKMTATGPGTPLKIQIHLKDSN